MAANSKCGQWRVPAGGGTKQSQGGLEQEQRKMLRGGKLGELEMLGDENKQVRGRGKVRGRRKKWRTSERELSDARRQGGERKTSHKKGGHSKKPKGLSEEHHHNNQQSLTGW